jgi:hypothetical protein
MSCWRQPLVLPLAHTFQGKLNPSIRISNLHHAVELLLALELTALTLNGDSDKHILAN